MRHAAPAIHAHVNFGLFCLTVLLYAAGSAVEVPPGAIITGRVHPMLLHLPIGMAAAVAILHFSSFYSAEARNARIISLLRYTATAGLLSALSGLLLAAEPDRYQLTEIDWHRHSGMVAAVVLYALSAVYGRIHRSWQHACLLATGVALVAAGHLGASITHGEDALFPEPAPLTAGTTATAPSGSSVYEAAILPILRSKCLDCHNSNKTKGELLMSDTLGFHKGGKTGAAIAWGQPDASLMIQRMHLPPDDEYHMPPKERKSLTDAEKKLLTAWVRDARHFSHSMNEIDPDSELYALLQPYRKTEERSAPLPTLPALSLQDVNKLNTHFRTARPLHEGSNAVTVSYFLRPEYNSQRLKELQSIRDNIVELNLSGMPVSDTDLSFIATCNALQKITLNNSRISAAGLLALSDLPHLHTLSVTGTTLNKEISRLWDKLKSLRVVFIGQTGIPTAQIREWQKKYPSIQFVGGTTSDETLQLTAPSMKNESTIIRKGERIVLHHYIQGARILYTTDGTDPDTLRGTEYKGPFAVQGSCDIRAVAVKDSWLASDPVRYSVFEKGSPPAEAKILTAASTQYPGQLEKTFINGKMAPVTNLRDPEWIAFRDKPFQGLFRYDTPKAVRKVSFSYALHIPQYVFPPRYIRVLAGNTPSSLTTVAEHTIPDIQPGDKEQVASRVVHMEMPATAYKYFKVEAANVPVIPSWHPGKGEKGWLFIDEIFFYD